MFIPVEDKPKKEIRRIEGNPPMRDRNGRAQKVARCHIPVFLRSQLTGFRNKPSHPEHNNDQPSQQAIKASNLSIF
jgi:hypothetical protein